MALADILSRIEGDAVAHAQALVDAARAEAADLLASARAEADAAAAATVRAAEAEGERGVQTVLAGARLEARDAALAARRALVERALDGVADAVIALPDAEYTAFLAKQVTAAARGGERVLVAEADAARLAGLEAAVRELRPDVALGFGGTTTAIAHGVTLVGERELVDLSVTGIVESRREALVMRLARDLFGEEAGA